MSHYLLPTPDAVAEMFNLLVGRPVTPKKGKPQFIRPGAKLTVAAFKGVDSEDVVGAAVFDMALSVYGSAALSMIPVTAVSGAVSSGALPDNIAENLGEVYNVACQLLATGEGEFSRLADHYTVASKVPADLSKAIKGTKEKIHVGIEIQGYGSGLASFYLL